MSFEPISFSISVLRMSTRCWTTGMGASSLWIVAPMVSRSACFCAAWRASAATLARCSVIWLQELTLGADQHRVGTRRAERSRRRVIAGGQRGAQPRDVELLGNEIVAQMIALGGVHGRIELDQDIAGLDALPVLHMDRAHDAGLERLDDLGAAARHDLARRGGDDVDVPEQAQASAAQNSAMIVTPMARPTGDGGVSTISSAAGRNASSSPCRHALR